MCILYEDKACSVSRNVNHAFVLWFIVFTTARQGVARLFYVTLLSVLPAYPHCNPADHTLVLSYYYFHSPVPQITFDWW